MKNYVDFWKCRSLSGVPALFNDPEVLKAEIDGFFEWCSNTAWNVAEQGKGQAGGTIIQMPKKIPFTMAGLCLYLGVNTNYFRDFEEITMLSMEPEKRERFSQVIMYAKEIIRTQKFIGAVNGEFNATIISQDLGMVSKMEVDHNNLQPIQVVIDPKPKLK